MFDLGRVFLRSELFAEPFPIPLLIMVFLCIFAQGCFKFDLHEVITHRAPTISSEGG